MLTRTRHSGEFIPAHGSWPRAHARSASLLLTIAMAAAGCTFTPPQRPLLITPAAAVNSATLDQYRMAVARRILDRNPSYVLQGTLQPMLRSLVVVSFTVDRNGQVVQSAVYRTNGDDEAESTALATLRRASPLPQPPAKLLNAHGPDRAVRRLAVQRQRQIPAPRVRLAASADDRLNAACTLPVPTPCRALARSRAPDCTRSHTTL